jgi:hypothetical protein
VKLFDISIVDDILKLTSNTNNDDGNDDDLGDDDDPSDDGDGDISDNMGNIPKEASDIGMNMVLLLLVSNMGCPI